VKSMILGCGRHRELRKIAGFCESPSAPAIPNG